jgi:C4-dicarboxylate-specific signal transduction histidine kinase
LAVPELLSPILHVDWRQVERWRIDQGAVPQDAVVLYRSPSFLESHQREALTAAAVFVAQASLIGVLLMERRRRQRAESSAAASRHELAHASRLAVAGELTAAVAHEINQPLGAILTNAETAELVLESGEDRRDLLRRILADIRRDDLRAGQVIQRLRTLLQKQEVSRQPFDLDVAVADAEAILRPEARRRAATLTVVPSGTTIAVTGDRIQIQQVLINLVLNALDAVAQVPEDRRRVSIAVHRTGAGGLIEVTDGGPGIPADQIEHVFESFFSTKRSGMGLGLSIARTLIEAHGGRIWAGNGTEGGAVFRVELPADGQSMPSARG